PLPAPPPPPAAGRAAPVWPLWVAVVLLAGGLGALAVREMPVPGLQSEAQTAAALGALDRRLATLEARPAAAAELGPVAERLAAAERRLAELAARPAPAPGASVTAMEALAGRVSTLESRPAPATGAAMGAATTEAIAAAVTPLAARLSALEQRPVPPPAATPDAVAQLNQRVSALEARAATADQTPRIAAIENKVALLVAATALQHRLAAGEPLGPALALLPAAADAPAALRAFAAAAPPTAAELRRDFTAAARAAKLGSTPEGGDAATVVRGFLSGLVTVRRGEEVVLGTSDSAALATAETRLDAGDLAGAVAALAPLTPGAAQAVAPWKARAQALLDARAALGALVS
ncbi:MAG: hypothetical protein IT556_03525, partial [Acetobacteraceae bacterium]|nr:hypothetical protein [Acetobacteraceae bacterium]